MTLAPSVVVNGSFVVERRRGRAEVYSGRRRSDGRPVLISHVRRSASPAAALRARLGYSIAGVAEVLLLDELTCDGITSAPELVLVEEMPTGCPLSESSQGMSPVTAVSLGESLCAIARAARAQGTILMGASPSLTFVRVDDGRAKLAGLAPRSVEFLATETYQDKTTDGPHAFEQPDLYVPPEVIEAELDPDKANAYLMGLLLAAAVLGRHPFAQLDGEDDQLSLMLIDQPSLADLPVPLERLLRAVLVADPARRIGLDELTAELRRLVATGI
jgi:hypothetical protein